MSNLSRDTELKSNAVLYQAASANPSFKVAAEQLSETMGQQVGTSIKKVSEKSTEYVEATRTYVEKHPIQSVLMAAGMGVLVGSVLGRIRQH